VFRHQFIEGDGFKVVLLWGGVFKHGGQSVFCTDLIRSKSRPKGQDFVSSLDFCILAIRRSCTFYESVFIS
ncbi:TPA: hypothetical protein ACGQNK_004048, partial [Yersinia enterocolitica]